MNTAAYILVPIFAAFGFYVAWRLVLRGRIRPLAALFLAVAAIFASLIQLSELNSGWEAILYTVSALFVCMPFAIGLIFGLIYGLLRRRKLHVSDD